MPLPTNDELATYVYLARLERQICPRIAINIKDGAPRHLVREDTEEYEAKLPVGGPKDERMSWGLNL